MTNDKVESDNLRQQASHDAVQSRVEKQVNTEIAREASDSTTSTARDLQFLDYAFYGVLRMVATRKTTI